VIEREQTEGTRSFRNRLEYPRSFRGSVLRIVLRVEARRTNLAKDEYLYFQCRLCPIGHSTGIAARIRAQLA
jgi:hypothetical protein